MRKITIHTLIALAVSFSLSSSVFGYVRWRNTSNNPMYWSGRTVTMNINTADFPANSQENVMFREAISEWNSQFVNGSMFSFGVQNSTRNDANSGDGVSSAGYEDATFIQSFSVPSSTIALTIPRARSNGEFSETDIVFLFPLVNTNWTFDGQMALCGGGVNFKEVAIHELGHALGLDHEEDVPCIMNGGAGHHYLGEGRDIQPNADDIAGLRAIYPNPLFSRTDLAAGNHWAFSNPTWLTTGQSFQMPFVVHNLGRNRLSNVVIGFYLSTDRNLNPSTDTFLGSITQTIEGGEEFVGRLSLTIPERTIPGNYHLGYIVDPSNVITEADEGNNRTDFCNAVQIWQGERVFAKIVGSPSSISYVVDGVNYVGTNEFVWALSSAHSLSTATIQNESNGSRYEFVNWGNTNQQGAAVQIIANRNTTYSAQFALSYFLQTVTTGPGQVVPASGWFRSGSVIELTGTPDGIDFGRWEGQGSGSYSGCLNPIPIRIQSPIIERALFEVNSASRELSISSSSGNQLFMVDGDTVEAPLRLCIDANASITVRPIVVADLDRGIRRAFQNWIDGDTSFTRIIGPGHDKISLVANYKTQYLLEMEVQGIGSIHPSTNWFDSSAIVRISAQSYCGSEFDRWDGTGHGSFDDNTSEGAVTMERGPIRQVARFRGGNLPTVDAFELFSGEGGSLTKPSLGDFDGDGDLDIYFNSYDGPDHLYRNDASVVFVDMIRSSQLPDDSQSRIVHVSIIDANGDGKLDIHKLGANENQLYLGNGDLTFREATPAILRNAVDCVRAEWCDYNADGNLDVVLIETRGIRLLKATGSFDFESVPSSEFSQLTDVSSATWTDYNCDSRADLLLLLQSGDCRLYRNDGVDRFRDVTQETNVEDIDQASNISWADFNNDGWIDILVAKRDHMLLYRNDQGRLFEKESRDISVNMDVVSAKWLDFDSDGRLDIAVLGDRNDDSFVQIFRNEGDSRFAREIEGVPVNEGLIHEEHNWTHGDVDQDGDMDIVVSSGREPSAFVVSTENTCGRYLAIELRDASGVAGISGAWVHITSGGTAQHRFLVDGKGTFGLGAATTVDQMAITWPNGRTQVFENIQCDKYLILDAPVSTAVREVDVAVLPTDFRLSQNYPNPFNPTTRIEFAIPVQSDVRLDVLNILGQHVRTLINQTLSPGQYSVEWDGRTAVGEDAPSGIYFYRISSGTFVESRKMLLLK